MKVNITLLFVSLLLAGSLQAQEAAVAAEVAAEAKISFPAKAGLINDMEGIFTPQQSKELGKIVTDYEAKTGRKIVVVSVASIAPFERFDDYSTELASQWQIGSEDKSDGVAIFFSKSLRQIKVSTGYGDEQSLSNEHCKTIIDTVIIPELKKGDFYQGIKLGVQELIRTWN